MRPPFVDLWGIIGFEDSYNSAGLLSVGDKDEVIRIATLPAIVTLKIMAFYERLDDRRKKDGADIGFIKTEYLKIPSNRERLAHGADGDIMTYDSPDSVWHFIRAIERSPRRSSPFRF